MSQETATRQTMKEEAIARLKLIGASKSTIRAYAEHGLIPTTDSTLTLVDTVRPASNNLLHTIDQIIGNQTYLMIMDTNCSISVTAFASVSETPENWESERLAIKKFTDLLKFPYPKGVENERQ